MYKEQTVLVTGAANGIGRAIAQHYYEAGANVVIADVNKEQGQAFALQLGERALFVEMDVRNEQSVQQAIAHVLKRFGAINIVINNAGISTFTDMFELTMDEFDNILATNLRSVFLVSREAAKHMNGGAIVNMASTRAFMSEPNAEGYAASKGGIVALTHAMASSLQ